MKKHQENSNKQITIRKADVSDLPRLHPLWLEFMSYHRALDMKYQFSPEDWPRVLSRFRHSLQNDQAVIFLAEIGRKMIGYTFGFVFKNYPGYLPEEIGFINDFLITRSYREKGVGTKLFEAIELWFREQSVRIIQLYVAYPNDKGMNFWQKCGFENYLVGFWKEI